MKTKLTILSALIVPTMMLTMGTATAQDGAMPGTSAAAEYVTSLPANALHANDLIGTDVKSSVEDDADIGTVNNVLLSHDGEIVGVVIGVGGFLGMGEKDVAVEWDSLDIAQEDNGDYVVRINASRDALEGAAEYQGS